MSDPATHANFVHLRVHTAYSVSEGAIRIKSLAELCKQQRMPAVAITDTNNLFGAQEFSGAMSGAGIQPIVGLQLAIGRRDGESGGLSKVLKKPEPDPVVLLAKDAAGYANLMQLTTKAFLETPSGETPQVSFADLVKHSAGVILLTGAVRGPIGRLLVDGQADAAKSLLQEMATAFKGRTYVEIQRHDQPLEKRTEPGFLKLAYELDLPLVATNECFFADASMYEAHDALLCIAGGNYVGQADRRRVTPEHRFKSAEEMRKLFADLPEAVDNTLVIAHRCAVMAEYRKPILPDFTTEPGESQEQALKRIAEAGLRDRLAVAKIEGEAEKPYWDGLAFEIDVINKMGFPGYFLIVADFIQWSKQQGIPVGPGRGSGAGSLVAWALTITDLDPRRFGLLFERFLNPERVSMPDFDIDFCQERRDEVIAYVQDKYGAGRVAQIITFGKLQARAALRDVGRVLEMPLGQVDRLCKMVPNNPAKPVTLKEAINSEPRLQAERDGDEAVARMMEVAQRLEGLYRNASTHAAGVVIGDRPLVDLVPLYRDPRSALPATQFSMKYVEEAGLVKFDFLGLKTLTVLDRAVKLLALRDVQVDINNLPLDDPKTYAMLARGETVGVFQFEGSGMRDLLREAKPENIEDLIALVALYRPGPMENIPKYIACKHGREKQEFLHETIEPVVKDTYGVIIYQEQVMQIAQVFAGYTLGQADLLRRAMGKKIKAEMDAQRDTFVQGAMARGVSKDRATYIFDLVDKFAGYGFNKSHSACYAYVAYQTAWLKANHPVEFMAASMTLDMGNTDKLNVFRQECQRLGVSLLGPDINRSQVEFSVETDAKGRGAVRYALAAVRNVGAQAMRLVVEQRTAKGPFKNLFDFATRLDTNAVNKRMLENLTKAGAFDQLEPNRARLLSAAELLLKHGQAAAADRATQQVSMFGEAIGTPIPTPVLPDIDGWLPMDQLAREFEAIGFYLSAHPLDTYGTVLKRLGVISHAEMLRGAGAGEQFHKLAGTVIGRQERVSARGNRFAFVQCSDPSGMFEVTVFTELLVAHRDLLVPGTSVILHVTVRQESDQTRLTVQKIEALDKLTANIAAGVTIFVNDDKPLDGLKVVLGKAGKGKGPVTLRLHLDESGEEAEIKLPQLYAISPQVRAALKAVRGVVDVHEM